MNAVDLIIKSANAFYAESQTIADSRYRSWGHCYKCFHDARNDSSPDYDYLSLHLAFYLASWGMYRGSSFLLQKDYKVHVPVVKELLKPQYDCLAGIKCVELLHAVPLAILERLNGFIGKYYDPIRGSVKGGEIKNEISLVLTTKILMGTLGCVPAYDRYFIDGVRALKVAAGNYNVRSLHELAGFYERHRAKFEKVRNQMRVHGLPYPQMKLLDMGFWQYGLSNDGKKG